MATRKRRARLLRLLRAPHGHRAADAEKAKREAAGHTNMRHGYLAGLAAEFGVSVATAKKIVYRSDGT